MGGHVFLIRLETIETETGNKERDRLALTFNNGSGLKRVQAKL